MKKVVVSACLLGENCKYSGGNNKSDALLELLAQHDDIEVVSVCPEVAGGLSIPRSPAELVDGVVIDSTGKSVDAEYRAGVSLIIDELRPFIERGEVAAAILQSRSPSCGVHEVYDGTFSGRLVSGKGMFARALESEGVRLIDVADI